LVRLIRNKNMNELIIIKKIWNFYLDRVNKNDLSIKKNFLLNDIYKATFSLNKTNLNIKRDHGKRSVMIIYASNRGVPLDLMKKAVQNYQKIDNSSNLNLIFVDVCKSKNSLSEMQILVAKSLLNIRLKDIWNALNNGYITLLISCTIKWFLRNKIDLICHFTSNNRLTEFYRLCAIKENIKQVEFLHGICSDTLAEYYEVLEAYSLRKDSKNCYVNLCPGLLQPDSINNNLLYYDDKQIFFRNEKIWKKSQKIKYDVLIIGGHTNKGKFLNSHFFDLEISTMKDLLNNDLNIVYCPHPSNMRYINEDILPKGVAIENFYNAIHSSKVIVGSNSTALFTSYLLGKSVLIYPKIWNLLPIYLTKIFDDKLKNTYSIEQVLKLTGSHNRIENKDPIKTSDYLDILNIN
jgi:hypothetical protein